MNKNSVKDDKEIMEMISKVIEKEKMEKSNPFLSTQIMARLEGPKAVSTGSVYQRVLNYSLVAVSAAIIIIGGINLGNFYANTVNENIEIIALNDAQIEYLTMLIDEEQPN